MKFIELVPNIFVNINHIVSINQYDDNKCRVSMINGEIHSVNKTYIEIRAMILKAE